MTLNYEQVMHIASALRDRRDSYLKTAELLEENAKLTRFWTRQARKMEDLAISFDELAVRLALPETNSVRITCKF